LVALLGCAHEMAHPSLSAGKLSVIMTGTPSSEIQPVLQCISAPRPFSRIPVLNARVTWPTQPEPQPSHPNDREKWGFWARRADVKTIQSQGSAGQERYRLIVSDGVHWASAMLATQKNDLIRSGQLKEFTVFKLDEFICNNVQNRKCVASVP
jgi:hypothetical protein